MLQFRIRGTNVQIFRAMPEGAGRKREPVGNASLQTGELSPRPQAQLTEADRAQISTWIERHRGIERTRQLSQFQTLPQHLAEVADWIAEASAEEVRPFAEDLQDAMRQVRVAMTRKLDGKPDQDAA